MPPPLYSPEYEPPTLQSMNSHKVATSTALSLTSLESDIRAQAATFVSSLDVKALVEHMNGALALCEKVSSEPSYLEGMVFRGLGNTDLEHINRVASKGGGREYKAAGISASIFKHIVEELETVEAKMKKATEVLQKLMLYILCTAYMRDDVLEWSGLQRGVMAEFYSRGATVAAPSSAGPLAGSTGGI